MEIISCYVCFSCQLYLNSCQLYSVSKGGRESRTIVELKYLTLKSHKNSQIFKIFQILKLQVFKINL